MFLRALMRGFSAFNKATTFHGKVALVILTCLICLFLWTLSSAPIAVLTVLIVVTAITLGVRKFTKEIKEADQTSAAESERKRLEEIGLQKAAEAQRRKAQKRQEDDARFKHHYTEWLRNHIDLIGKFMLIAERKVSLVDEYGDENWDALTKEIQAVTKKIVKRDGFVLENGWPRSAGSTGYDSGTYWQMLNRLRTDLANDFRKYHDDSKLHVLSDTDLAGMNGVEFEVLIARLLISDGYDVGGTPTTGDQGADLIATKNGRTIAIQAKRYAAPVGNSAVQEIVAALRFYRADEGWVITNSTFTASAEELARANGVRLVDGIELLRMLGQQQSSLPDDSGTKGL